MRAVLGSAYGIAKAGIGIASVGVMKPDFVMKALVPVIFAAAIGIYGLIIAVLISDNGMCVRVVCACERVCVFVLVLRRMPSHHGATDSVR